MTRVKHADAIYRLAKTHRLASGPDAWAEDDLAVVERARYLSTLEPARFAMEAGRSGNDGLRFEILAYLMRRAPSILSHDDGLDHVEGLAVGAFGMDSVEHCNVLFHGAALHMRLNDPGSAMVVARRAESSAGMRRLATLYQDYVQCMSQIQCARAAMALGSFWTAETYLKDAGNASDFWAFSCSLEHNFYTGELLWRLGRFEDAIRVHKNRTIRERASALGHFDTLLLSHNAAGKAAVDGGMLDVAREELLQSRSLARRHPPLSPTKIGYTYMYAGELELARGNQRSAISWLEGAQNYFSRQALPHREGIEEVRRLMDGIRSRSTV